MRGRLPHGKTSLLYFRAGPSATAPRDYGQTRISSSPEESRTTPTCTTPAGITPISVGLLLTAFTDLAHHLTRGYLGKSLILMLSQLPCQTCVTDHLGAPSRRTSRQSETGLLGVGRGDLARSIRYPACRVYTQSRQVDLRSSTSPVWSMHRSGPWLTIEFDPQDKYHVHHRSSVRGQVMGAERTSG